MNNGIMHTTPFPRGYVLALSIWFLLVNEAGLNAEEVSYASGQPLPALTNAAQVRALSIEEAQRGYPVRLRGVLTYCDRDWILYFVQDAAAGIYISAPKPFDVEEGQLVEVTGVTCPGAYAPYVDRPQMVVLGSGQLPQARAVDFTQLATGAEDSQWIEMTGLVRAVEPDDRHFKIKLACDPGFVEIQVPSRGQNVLPLHLVGAKVRVHGVGATQFDTKGHLTGVRLLVPRIEDFVVEEKAAADPFSLPLQSIDSFLRFRPARQTNALVRVRGAVTFQIPGRTLFVNDGTNGLYVASSQPDRLEIGDQIEVVGFPQAGGCTPFLADAIFRRLGPGQPPPPKSITVVEALNEDVDCDLVTIEAYLVERVAMGGEVMLVLQQGYRTFHAFLTDDHQGAKLRSLLTGSHLRLQGVCSVETDANGQPQSFRILLRSPRDVEVLALPSGWTARRLGMILFAASGLILLGVAWLLTLKREVRRQTTLAHQRLLAEAAVEKRFSDLVEHANDMVYTHDLEGRFTSINPAGEKLLGYRHQELIGSDLSLVVRPEMLAILRQQQQAKLDGQAQTVYELEFTHRSGRPLQVEISSWLVRQDHQPLAVQAIARDITERKRAEEALRSSQARLQLQFERMPIACISWDCEHRVTSWNPAAEAIFGFSAQEAIGKRPHEFLIMPEQQPLIQRVSERLLAGDSTVRDVNPNQTKDGRTILCEWTNTPLHDVTGAYAGSLSMVQDITEKKSLEKQLLRVQRLESIGTLAAGIAHDLNNILTPIMVSAEMLGLDKPQGDEAEMLATIQGSAQRGADIVKQVLTFARGVDGERVSLQPRYLIKEMEKIARETFPRNITIHCEACQNMWTVIGDATQLHQVLLNLCVNARDAMPKGGVLTLSAENIEVTRSKLGRFADGKAGPHVLIQVTDTGEGIPPTIMEIIFDPFFTTKEQGKGTGLGLSTVLGIVRSHGGFVDLQSEPGRGTTFKVYLPAQREQAAVAAGTSTPRSLPRGNGECVLVVDDEAGVRSTAERTLTGHGYQVLTAANGKEALGLMSERDTEVKAVVTDVMMPVMDGVALARALRQSRPHLPIIACTGWGQEGVQENLKALGVSLLEKPYPMEALLSALRNQLTRPRSRET